MSSSEFQGPGFYSDKNSSRVLQPPGGASSNIFGAASDAQGTPPQKANRMTSGSNIFGAAETESPSRKVNTRMQSDIFGTTGSAPPSQQQARSNRMKSDIFGGAAPAQEPARSRKDHMGSDIFKEPGPSDQVMPRKLKGKEDDLYADPQTSPASGDAYKYDGGKAAPDHYLDQDRAGRGDAWAHDEVSYHDTNPSHYDTAVMHDAPITTPGGENIFDVRYGYTPQKPGRRIAQGAQPNMAATFLNLFGTDHPDGPDGHPPPTAQPPAPTNMPAEALGYKPAPARPAVPGHQRAAAGVVSGARDARGPSAVFPEEQAASSDWRPSAKYKLRYQAALVNPITGETYASPDFDLSAPTANNLPAPTTNGTANGCGEDGNPMDGQTPAERPSTKVMQPPGGGSSFTLG
ncbi:uncharacterized protein LOC118418787 [Branchiostoma floridae]|uniref:Microtubule-associated protein Jupiter n=1 Tax=Branchiostoma floridae TaxID=7739 RepID=A0A9J7MW18_BRAFL|nr:uncharacterized protein LOC118418787 [Branchiostoma floridae]